MRFICYLSFLLVVAPAIVLRAGDAVTVAPAKAKDVPTAWPESWRVVYRRIELLQKAFLQTIPTEAVPENLGVRRILSKGNCFYQNGILTHQNSKFTPATVALGEPVDLVVCTRVHAGSISGYYCLPRPARLTGRLNERGEFDDDVTISWLTQPDEAHWPDAMEFATQNYLIAYEPTDIMPPESETLGFSSLESYKLEIWQQERPVTTFGFNKFGKTDYEPRKVVPADGLKLRVSSPNAKYHALVKWHIFRNGKLVLKLPVDGNHEFLPLPKERGQYAAMIIAPAPTGGLRVSNYIPWQMRD
jgi:hypothetical protein